jgi:hypothetical protein
MVEGRGSIEVRLAAGGMMSDWSIAAARNQKSSVNQQFNFLDPKSIAPRPSALVNSDSAS